MIKSFNWRYNICTSTSFIISIQKKVDIKSDQNHLNRQNWVAFMPQPYWVHLEVEVEVELMLRCWGLFEAEVEVQTAVEMRLSWSLVETELKLSVSVSVGPKNWFGVNSCSWAPFIFYDSFSPDFWGRG